LSRLRVADIEVKVDDVLAGDAAFLGDQGEETGVVVFRL
jgi:hypothetical protein